MSSTNSAVAPVTRLAPAGGIRLVLDTCLKVALANALSSFITAWAHCEHTWREEGRTFPPTEWASLQCPVPHFGSYFVYNIGKGASLLQFAALYTALRLHFYPARRVGYWDHMMLCAVWVFATYLGECVTIMYRPKGDAHGMELDDGLVGHHQILPEEFFQSEAHTHFAFYGERPALFFAFAASQRETAPTTTGAYGRLLYWALPQLPPAVGMLVATPILHLLSLMKNLSHVPFLLLLHTLCFLSDVAFRALWLLSGLIKVIFAVLGECDLPAELDRCLSSFSPVCGFQRCGLVDSVVLTYLHHHRVQYPSLELLSTVGSGCTPSVPEYRDPVHKTGYVPYMMA